MGDIHTQHSIKMLTSDAKHRVIKNEFLFASIDPTRYPGSYRLRLRRGVLEGGHFPMPEPR